MIAGNLKEGKGQVRGREHKHYEAQSKKLKGAQAGAEHCLHVYDAAIEIKIQWLADANPRENSDAHRVHQGRCNKVESRVVGCHSHRGPL